MSYNAMIDILLILAVYVTLLVIILRIMIKHPFALNAELTSKTPVTKKFKVKITGSHGEKLEFYSLPEEDINQVIETIVALKQKED